MRMTTSLKKLLGIQHLLVTGSAVEDGALVIEVRPSWRAPRCSGCKKRRHDSDRPAVRPDRAGRGEEERRDAHAHRSSCCDRHFPFQQTTLSYVIIIDLCTTKDWDFFDRLERTYRTNTATSIC